ncbi:DUF1344 domain-containing protein [Aureimonas psammosilenae]|uniref:DUF1344 domain-containing protein n=1 Tax=Aureimonas psammosilenae TaxID=2495496 RepID=UPI001260E4C7|nr:DUF1344 domain-containing protein [Aureimonas psammosilenae]
MTNKEIIAFFASSFLCVSMTIPVHAEEKTGTVAALDPDLSTITFEDGSSYALPKGFDYAAVVPGMEAHVILKA